MKEEAYQQISIDNISAPKPREDAKGLAWLADSLSHVFINPPTVAPTKAGKYQLIAGNNRVAAAKRAGMSTIWCHVLPHGPDTPIARLAFIDENVVRLDLPAEVKDELLVERRRILNALSPATAPAARKAAGKRDLTLNPGKVSPSRKTSERDMQEATRRLGSSPSARSLYADGKLKKSQMDELVTLPLGLQAEVAAKVAGKGITETKALVREAKARDAAPMNAVKHLVATFKQVEKQAYMLTTSIEAANRALGGFSQVDLSGAGIYFVSSALMIAHSACADLISRIDNSKGQP